MKLRCFAILWLCPLFALADGSNELRLTIQPFNALNVPKESAAFYANHFAQQLAAMSIRVISASDAAALLGLQKQKQLLGCNDGDCLIELANALGADGIVTGDVGRFGDELLLNLRVLDPGGRLLSSFSGQSPGERELLVMLTRAARQMGPEIARARHKTITALEPVAEPSRNGIAVNLVVPFLLGGAYGGEYTRTLRDRWVLVADLSVFAAVRASGGSNPERTTGAAFGVGPRFYPFGNAPNGLFAGALLELIAAGITGTSTPQTFLAPGFDVHVGYGLLIGNRLSLSLMVGLKQFDGLEVNGLDGTTGFGASGVLPWPRANIGFAF